MSDYGLVEEPFNARVAVEAADGKGYYLQFTWQENDLRSLHRPHLI